MDDEPGIETFTSRHEHSAIADSVLTDLYLLHSLDGLRSCLGRPVMSASNISTDAFATRRKKDSVRLYGVVIHGWNNRRASGILHPNRPCCIWCRRTFHGIVRIRLPSLSTDGPRRINGNCLLLGGYIPSSHVCKARPFIPKTIMSCLYGPSTARLCMSPLNISWMSTCQATNPRLVMATMVCEQNRKLQEEPKEGAHCRVIHELPWEVEP
eukprot:135633-Amphidinium_carterae.1